jgi:hypothetical protein
MDKTTQYLLDTENYDFVVAELLTLPSLRYRVNYSDASKTILLVKGTSEDLEAFTFKTNTKTKVIGGKTAIKVL